ncbi:MAG: gamma-glutamylcyclotransferase [Rhizobiaceae bacterium]|nr:gamma-glutamylcyclotransferase [Rhizobiaceae bacterium]
MRVAPDSPFVTFADMQQSDSTVEDNSDSGLVAYFGYGSLVNRATHRTRILDAIPASLVGWRRFWRPRPDMPGFPAALLTVREEEGAVCDGLLVVDRAEHLAAVDAREARYRRVAVSLERLRSSRAVPRECPVYVFVADEHVPIHPERPLILRSYLDAVLQGFLDVHGEDGVRRFIAETDGFDTGLHDDRADPIYPRSVALRAGEADLFARHLAHLTRNPVS